MPKRSEVDERVIRASAEVVESWVLLEEAQKNNAALRNMLQDYLDRHGLERTLFPED